MKKILILVCVVALAGCYKDTEEELYPNWTNNTGGCDTTNVSFATTIKPIIDQYCAVSGCHDAITVGGGYNFTAFAGVNLSKGRIIGAITQQSGYNPMPKGAGKLNDCEISQITAWVNAGAQNN